MAYEDDYRRNMAWGGTNYGPAPVPNPGMTPTPNPASRTPGGPVSGLTNPITGPGRPSSPTQYNTLPFQVPPGSPTGVQPNPNWGGQTQPLQVPPNSNPYGNRTPGMPTGGFSPNYQGNTQPLALGNTTSPRQPGQPYAPPIQTQPDAYTQGMAWSTSPYNQGQTNQSLAALRTQAGGSLVPKVGDGFGVESQGKPYGAPAPSQTLTGPTQDTQNPYGSIGRRLDSYGQGFNEESRTRPQGFDPFYQDQFSHADPGESSPGGWSGPHTITTRDGKQVVQTGREGNGAWYDPELGWVADVTNPAFSQQHVGGPDYRMLAAVLAGGAGLTALAGGGLAGAAGEAAGGAMDMYGSAAIPGQAGTIFDAAGGAAAGATPAAAGAYPGITPDPSMTGDMFSGMPTLAADPVVPGATTATGSTIGNLINNPIARGVIGPVVNGLANGGNSNGSHGLPTGGNTPGNGATPGNGNTLPDLLTGGLNFWNDNNSIHNYEDMVNRFINRGDYNSQYRPGQLARLNDFLMHPDSALQDQGYKDMRDRSLEDQRRNEAAHGMNLSGNEMGDLTKLRTEMDYKQIQSERSQLMQAAGLGNPGQMATAGINAAGNIAQMTANRNAAANGLIQRLTQNGLPANVAQTVGNWFSQHPGGDWHDAPPEVQQMLNDAAQHSGQSVDDYVNSFTDTGPNLGNLGPDYGADVDYSNIDPDILNYWGL